ncbi:MAG: penicillin-binding transpeptidase domain-containing protein [Candidatus Moduliflexus flocculans]|nr:penicillin-binding transpeptidase domain-containing protein [Candidatus Moduliflexus flocculans]
MAGKTGTAQKMDPVTKRYSRDRFISSFVGFVPAGDPRIAMIIIINEPRGQIYGGIVAAPVFRDIANEALSCTEDSEGRFPGKGSPPGLFKISAPISRAAASGHAMRGKCNRGEPAD